MNKKIYVKNTSSDPIYKSVSTGFIAKTRILPSILVFSGLFVFSTQVLLPLVVFKTYDEHVDILENATILGRTTGFSDFEFTELEKKNSQTDYIFANETEYIPRKNTNVQGKKTANLPDFFYITIPKLRIKDALVETNAASLQPDYALGHYPGTEMPGEVGNSFIFGHSVLPWFFNPNNYKTIFSTLDKLNTGDEFTIAYNNRDYRYIVESKVELLPQNVDPLAEFKPRYLNESTITLMTCSPAGTKLRRLLVNAVLVN